jgi:hypothetical protein
MSLPKKHGLFRQAACSYIGGSALYFYFIVQIFGLHNKSPRIQKSSHSRKSKELKVKNWQLRSMDHEQRKKPLEISLDLRNPAVGQLTDPGKIQKISFEMEF